MSASKWHMVIVILSWVVFSLFQVIVKSELPVTICAIALCLVLLARREKGELMLYFFGLFMGIVVEVGLITPPVGMNLFIINGVARDIPIARTYAGVAPFVMSDLVRVVILVAFPGITLWLVSVTRPE